MAVTGMRRRKVPGVLTAEPPAGTVLCATLSWGDEPGHETFAVAALRGEDGWSTTVPAWPGPMSWEELISRLRDGCEAVSVAASVTVMKLPPFS